MEINYKQMSELIDIRMKQISDASLEYEYFNQEFNKLQKIRNEISQLLILERKNWKDMEPKKKESK